MPIYEYQCTACAHKLEALQKLSDSPLLECPACKAPSLQKQVSAAGFRLKGGGWYETDFKSGSKKNVAEGGSAAAATGAGTGGSTGGGTDSGSTPSASGGCGTGCSAHSH